MTALRISHRLGCATISRTVDLALEDMHFFHVARLGVRSHASPMLRNPEIQLLPLGIEQTKQFALLSGVRDPFDRRIVVAARSMRCPLVSADETIAASGLVRVIWE